MRHSTAFVFSCLFFVRTRHYCIIVVLQSGCAVLCCTVLCCVVLCCVVLCCVVLCCTVLCCMFDAQMFSLSAISHRTVFHYILYAPRVLRSHIVPYKQPSGDSDTFFTHALHLFCHSLTHPLTQSH